MIVATNPASWPPALREPVAKLFEAEEFARRARRQLIARDVEGDGATATLTILIDAAIGELVAARQLITSAAAAAPSKDL